MHDVRIFLAFVGFTASILSCATTHRAPEFKKSRVIERIGDLEETPKWASGEVSMFEEKGNAVFVNTASMSGDARTEACVRAAAERGRAEMLRYVKDSVTTSGQLNEESSSKDPGVESLVAFLAQGNLSGVKVGAQYWEKREESDASGVSVLRIHCAAQITISKTSLEKQLREAINGERSGNPQIRERLLEAQKKFIDGLAPQVEEKGAPSAP
jgi:hypothetical protein